MSGRLRIFRSVFDINEYSAAVFAHREFILMIRGTRSTKNTVHASWTRAKHVTLVPIRDGIYLMAYYYEQCNNNSSQSYMSDD